eukprot:2349641-Pleurochrysis_carterae.AAC.5
MGGERGREGVQRERSKGRSGASKQKVIHPVVRARASGRVSNTEGGEKIRGLGDTLDTDRAASKCAETQKATYTTPNGDHGQYCDKCR